VPLDIGDFANAAVLQMDIIDNMLKSSLQSQAQIRGWSFFLIPYENNVPLVGPGHITLETDDSRTFSYEFHLRNPHPELDILDRTIKVQSFGDLSHCARP
jgi:hypothetical protein